MEFSLLPAPAVALTNEADRQILSSSSSSSSSLIAAFDSNDKQSSSVSTETVNQIATAQNGVTLNSWNRHQERKLLHLNRSRSELAKREQGQHTCLHGQQWKIDIKQLGFGESLRAAVLAMLRRLCTHWADCTAFPDPLFTCQRMSGAMTNCMFMCYFTNHPEDRVLLRIYGEGKLLKAIFIYYNNIIK
jgi:hypothetical protein